MGRLPRRNLGAGVYHIYNRCANNLWLLDSQECKNKFLELLERLSGKYELNIYHYCVMSNHFHIAAEGNAEYLSLPYDEDLKEFRSSASVLGDKDFLARLSSKAGRLFLRPERPAKENNLIADE